MTPGATELTRMAYLQAMGIDSYISRGQLPGAAVTSRLLVVSDRPDTVGSIVGETAPVPDAGAPAAPLMPQIERPLERAPDRAAPRPLARRQATGTPAAPAFSIAAIVAGGLLWLEELSHPLLAREQVQLVQAMARALGLPGDQVDITQFDWPIHNNSQFDLGEEAARAGLAGFIARKVEKKQCRGLVLLGEACDRRIEPTGFADLTRIATVSTAAMLADHRLKRQAWADLLPVARGI